MVRVQVRFSLAKSLAQFSQNLFYRRRPEIELTEVCHHVRFPPAVNTTPSIADEAEYPKPAMVCVIPALRRRPATFVVQLSRPPSVFRAIRFLIAERPASRRVARMLR